MITPATIEDVRRVLRNRFVTVISDLPLGQPLQASAEIALKEVQENVSEIIRSIR